MDIPRVHKQGQICTHGCKGNIYLEKSSCISKISHGTAKFSFFFSFVLGWQRPNLITGQSGWWAPHESHRTHESVPCCCRLEVELIQFPKHCTKIGLSWLNLNFCCARQLHTTLKGPVWNPPRTSQMLHSHDNRVELGETWGAGEENQENKKIFVPTSKK